MSAGALTLGAGHGRAVLGSPLDMSFDVRADDGRELDDACVSARVDMGSTLVADNQVSVHLVQASVQPHVQVRTRVPVDEPVVVVRLEVTCGGRMSRTYTFLSELPGEAQASTVTVPSIQRGEVAESGGGVRVPEEGRAKSTGQKAGTRATRKSLVSSTERRTKAKVKTAGARPPAAHAAPLESAPKLVMEPLDVWQGTPPELRLSVDPPRFADAGSASAQRQGAAETWQVLETPVQELAKLSQRVAETEREVQALRVQLRQEQAAGLQAQQQLKRAVSERYAAWVVYGLAGLLVLALLGWGWLAWQRRRQTPNAWHQSTTLRDEELETDALSEAVSPTVWPQTEEPDAPATKPVVEIQAADPPAPSQEDEEDEAVFAPVQAPLATVESAAPVALHVQDIEHPEDLFDVLQQAEFFISIGEHEQAIESLRRHIGQHAASSPLAYLELLRLYHALGRAAAFDELRASFEERFNAEVPSFATFQRGGRSLEDYPADLERIESLWGSAEVLDELDRLMFRRGGAQAVARFDLPAYEDLLLLLAITPPAAGKGRGAASAPPPAAAVAQPARPSVDTLAGDLALEPSRPMPVQGGPSAGRGAAGRAPRPEIVAPEELPFDLEPRDHGGRRAAP